jgi:hypothetical protein
MAQNRQIRIRWMTPGRPRALAFDAAPDATIVYSGGQQTVKLNR